MASGLFLVPSLVKNRKHSSPLIERVHSSTTSLLVPIPEVPRPVMCLDCGMSYTDLHVCLNDTELYTHIAPMSVSEAQGAQVTRPGPHRC